MQLHVTRAKLVEHLTIASICEDVTDLMAIDWDAIAKATKEDPVLSELMLLVNSGSFEKASPTVSQYTRYFDSLYIQDNVVMYRDRVVVPLKLRRAVLDVLHAAHQGVSSMQMRAQKIVFWPGITRDIAERRNLCGDCNRNAPTQASTPAELEPELPSCPFESIFADFFEFGGSHYLVAGDRLSGFTEVFHTPSGTSSAGSRGLVKCLRKWFATFGVPMTISSDGGPEFIASHTQEFLRSWRVKHRVSSAYNSQSNGRAEVAVKTVKRLMRSNLGPLGSLDSDKFLSAMLQLRNSPDPDCGISPAEIVFGRRLRDNLLFADYSRRERYSQRWQEAWSAKEQALKARFVRTTEQISEHSRPLQPLRPGDKCFVQNQAGNHAKKWHCSGTIMEVLPHNKYAVMIDGSGRVTHRNRRFLRLYHPVVLNVRSPTTRGWEQPTFNEPLLMEGASEPRSDVHPGDVSEQKVPSSSSVGVPQADVVEADGSHQHATTVDESTPVITRKEPRALRCLRPYIAPGLKVDSPVRGRLRSSARIAEK